jgi:predicted transposase/invertase (TIGR01784 family)
LQEGLNQGELNGIRKVAKSMKDSGIDINLITSATGLSLEEIQSL